MFSLNVDVCDYSEGELFTEKVHSSTFLLFSMGILGGLSSSSHYATF